MFCAFKLKRIIISFACVIILVMGVVFVINSINTPSEYTAGENGEASYIKWIDFKVTYPALKDAMDLDIKSHNDENSEFQYNWIDVLAYLATKYGGDFKKYSSKDIDALKKRIENGETLEDITKDMKNYNYFSEAYSAILSEFIGIYRICLTDENGDPVWHEKYGLKAFSPLAEGYQYSHFDDFGEGRSYGYKRKHLGHDYMAQAGAPVIAVESGMIEELGWNQYGYWYH